MDFKRYQEFTQYYWTFGEVNFDGQRLRYPNSDNKEPFAALTLSWADEVGWGRN